MIYLYAFCPTPIKPLSLPQGIAHPAVQWVSVGELGAIAESDLDISQLEQDDTQLMQAVLAHDRVLVEVFAQTVLLPLRFGTQLVDAASLQKHLQTHQGDYLQQLAALADKAEYLVKLAPKPLELPPPDETVKGRDYFLAKKQRLQAQSQYQTQVETEFQHFLSHLQATGIPFVHSDPYEGEERLHVLSGRDPAIAQTHIATWQASLPSWQIFYSEPLPPYHFAR